jgi:8-oxo-dGTP pyrophosphatase MutT (NUDIX family)
VKVPTLADFIEEAEISQLNADYGSGERRRVSLEMSGLSFEDWLRIIVTSPNRRGEVVLAIRRPDGQTLLHTKRFYPQGIYRLPSGGVHPDEMVLSSVIRETKEETGLDVIVDRFLGMIEYEFCHAGRQLPFVSYVFLVRANNSRPAVQDPEEQIIGFRYVAPQEIRTVAAQLRTLPPEWADWGNFRAPPHDMVADVLEA